MHVDQLIFKKKKKVCFADTTEYTDSRIINRYENVLCLKFKGNSPKFIWFSHWPHSLTQQHGYYLNPQERERNMTNFNCRPPRLK